MLAGCASAPVQEMSNARQALQAARDAGGGEDPLYRRAAGLLNDAERAIDRQRYAVAREKANRAGELAIRLIRRLHSESGPSGDGKAPDGGSGLSTWDST